MEGSVPLSCESQTSASDHLVGQAPLPEFDSQDPKWRLRTCIFNTLPGAAAAAAAGPGTTRGESLP